MVGSSWASQLNTSPCATNMSGHADPARSGCSFWHDEIDVHQTSYYLQTQYDIM